MSRTDGRQQRLLALLHGGAFLTVEEIQKSFGPISERHIRRWIATLRKDGAPICEERIGRHKRFYIAPEHRRVETTMLSFTEEEVLALAVAAEASRAALAPTPLGAPLANGFDALLKQLSTEVFSFETDQEREHWYFGASSSTSLDPTIFRDLTQAIRECRRVRIDYMTASTGKRSKGRLIEPYAMAVRNGSWLVVAYCRTKRAIRDFSLAGISRLELCDPETEDAFFTTSWEFDLEDYFRQRFSALAGDRMYDVCMLIEPDRAEYFRRKRYHSSQRIVETRPDGRLVVTYRVAGLEEMRTFAQGWGVGVTVLEPVELVERMRSEAGVLVERYGTGTLGEAISQHTMS